MMKLGIIASYDEKSLKKVADFGLAHVEFCINKNHDAFIKHLKQTQQTLSNNKLRLASLGRWGTNRMLPTGINQVELNIDLELIQAAHQLGSTLYVAGINYVETLSLEENMNHAILYLKTLKSATDQVAMKLAVYNCRWENFIVGPDEWDVVISQIPGIGIKYDPSHAIRDQQDYLKEVLDYGPYMYHIHLKGSLIVDQKVVDDPPAGLDSTDWQSFMALLYYLNYQETLSLEPHSSTWTGHLGDQGVLYSIDYFKKIIWEDKK